MRHNVVILGTGPSGLTAALYTARAGLKPLVLHGDTPGGQLTTTTEVENFPGFIDGIDGNELINNITEQAKRFGAAYEYGIVRKVKQVSGGFSLHLDDDKEIHANAVIVATGARPRKLGLPSEEKYWSKGVTSCATCDGFFYRGKEVCVVGGGDSAVEEATFLTRFCPKVYMIHRRDELRASKIMADRALKHDKIEVIWNAKIAEILGDSERKGLQVTGVKLQSTVDNTERVLDVEGVFLGIGHIPNTEVIEGLVELDPQGYAITQPDSSKTNIPGLYVCGDAQDTVFRQAITAAGTGCMAAIECERYLESINL